MPPWFILLLLLLVAVTLVASASFFIKRPTPATVVYQPLGRGFWWRWVLTTALVGSGGFFVSYFFAIFMAQGPLLEGGNMVLLGLLFGAFLGATQARCLRPHWANAHHWLWATLGTWAMQIGASLELALAFVPQSRYITVIFILPLIGMLAALPQWWVLRPHTPNAAWWLILNAGIWPVSLLVAIFIALPTLITETNTLPIVSPLIIGSVLGCLNGLLTASALVWLCRTPHPPPAAPPKNPV